MTRYFLASTLLLCTAGLVGCDGDVSKKTASNIELVTSAEQDDVRMEIHAATLNAEAGEPIELIVTIDAPPSMRASLELPEDDQLGAFDVLRIEEARETGEALSVADKRRLLISTFESGEVQLPPLLAHYGTDSVLATEPVNFSITSLVDGEFNPADYDDIRGPVENSLGDDRVSTVIYALALGGGVLLVALAIAIVLGMRRRIRPRIPHEWALAELARIDSEGRPQPGRTAARFEKIESVLRWYVVFRFEIDAPDQTSNELLEAVVDHTEIDDTARAILERLVREADRVKFAAGLASADECSAALGSARLFVESTIPATKGKEDAA